ncbi:PQ loop repeat-domain-containing protein [Aspergillus cavernicola]|uniref:PQ loop repeat-domain-containing protein n=1 Tax=Aspergillus cavernicola TaxID=176166 RepID=A0ABR4HSG2_9EURO
MAEKNDGNITLSSNVLGTIGTVLWCIQLIPQIWSNWRRKNTEGFPQLMMLLWGVCAVPMGAYFILQEVNIPLQIQPQVFGFFSLVAWGQILYYTHKFSALKATAMVIAMVALFGGIEAALILSLGIPYQHGITWPDLLVGVLAAVFLAAGLIPPYFELWKRDGRVIGISMLVLFFILRGLVDRVLIIPQTGFFYALIRWGDSFRFLRWVCFG